MLLKNTIISSNTGLDAIKKAPIVNYSTNTHCLRIQDISQHKTIEKWGYTIDNDKNSKFYLKQNDIIIARTGSTIGINMIIKNDINSVYNNGLVCLKINQKEFVPYYIYLFLQTTKYKNFINGISGSSATQPNLRIDDLLSLAIPNYNLSTQQHIVDTISILLCTKFC